MLPETEHPLRRATGEQQRATLIDRELTEPSDIVAFLSLRHRVYFEEHRYGVPKPLGLDLTAYAARSRMYGVFDAGSPVGEVSQTMLVPLRTQVARDAASTELEAIPLYDDATSASGRAADRCR